jgi:histidine ammonia-lyase
MVGRAMRGGLARMMITLHSRGDLSFANFAAVSRDGAAIRLTADARARMDASHAAFIRFIHTEPTPWVYGVTGTIVSGRGVILTPQERRAEIRRPVAAGAVLFGEPMPERIVRGILFCRLSNFIEGHAAVRADVALAVTAMLERTLPQLPRSGHGAAGEMSLLSHLFGALTEELHLEEKEASALINGAPVAAALTADMVLRSDPLLREVVDVFALAIDVYRAPLDAYDPVLGELWQNPYAERALALLARSMAPLRKPPRLPQAPVSFRAIPRMLARALRSFDGLRLAAERAISAVTDNPVVVGEGESIRILANGGFFDADAPAIFDDFAGVCGDLIRLMEKLAARLAETADLATLPRPVQARLRGLVSALAGYAEDVTATVSRTLVPGTDGGGAPQNDLISPLLQAWAKQTAAIDLLSSAAAVLRAVAACVQGDINVNPLELDQVLRGRMASVTNLELSLE